MLNVVAIMGRLARDPELRQTNSGKNVCTFCIACDRGRRDINGQKQADWIDVTAWEKTAEFICRYFQKGSLIVVDGRLQTRQYQDKNGQTRTATEIVAQNVNFAGSKESTHPAAENAVQRPAAATQGVLGEHGQDYYDTISDDDGDLPF